MVTLEEEQKELGLAEVLQLDVRTDPLDVKPATVVRFHPLPTMPPPKIRYTVLVVIVERF